MSSIIRRHGPYLTITLLIVFFFITYLFTTPQPVQLFGTQLVQWASVVGYFAILVGTIDIVIYHLKPLRSKESGQWQYSAVLLIVTAIGLVTGTAGVLSGAGLNYQPFAWLYNAIYVPSNATVYAILVFYIASASYRAFRIKNAQAAFLVLVGFIIMFADIGLGYVIWPGFVPLGNWINTYPVAAAFRPIIIGSGLGVIITGLRALLGRDVYGR
ncbi:MAG TPA: hypothetical protein VK503_08920 [Candidatus Bathyarchaeia archaeon]|nr:hypothetical protein [Candidatus Bathyarchaeia archaeon]